MTREEALDKDAAIAEIIEAVRNLPAMVVTFGEQRMAPDMINRHKVIAILKMYGFHG